MLRGRLSGIILAILWIRFDSMTRSHWEKCFWVGKEIGACIEHFFFFFSLYHYVVYVLCMDYRTIGVC